MSGGTTRQEAFDEACAFAVLDGFEVVGGDDRTLLLDLDSPHAWVQYERVLRVVEEHYLVESIESWASKSGNTHVRVKLFDPVPQSTRYALQAALGSDGVREALHFVQLANGVAEPCVLFKPPR